MSRRSQIRWRSPLLEWYTTTDEILPAEERERLIELCRTEQGRARLSEQSRAFWQRQRAKRAGPNGRRRWSGVNVGRVRAFQRWKSGPPHK